MDEQLYQKLTVELQTLNGFERWLKSKEPFEVIGSKNSSFRENPLTAFLEFITDLKVEYTSYNKLIIFHSGDFNDDRVKIKASDKAHRLMHEYYMFLMSHSARNTTRRDITAYQALEILYSI